MRIERSVRSGKSPSVVIKTAQGQNECKFQPLNGIHQVVVSVCGSVGVAASGRGSSCGF